MATTVVGRGSNVRAYPADRSRWATVRVETDGGTYVGRIYVPDTNRRVSDVLADDRQFLSLTDVRVNDSEQVEAYMAVNKSFVRTLRILDEGGTDGRIPSH
ncbi:MAG TPA: hypothetical protein VFK70_06600 [Vicinamibacteria bacterium]|nr:hypothetical protein [Vicinamibacteria bacterium]